MKHSLFETPGSQTLYFTMNLEHRKISETCLKQSLKQQWFQRFVTDVSEKVQSVFIYVPNISDIFRDVQRFVKDVSDNFQISL